MTALQDWIFQLWEWIEGRSMAWGGLVVSGDVMRAKMTVKGVDEMVDALQIFPQTT